LTKRPLSSCPASPCPLVLSSRSFARMPPSHSLSSGSRAVSAVRSCSILLDLASVQPQEAFVTRRGGRGRRRGAVTPTNGAPPQRARARRHGRQARAHAGGARPPAGRPHRPRPPARAYMEYEAGSHSLSAPSPTKTKVLPRCPGKGSKAAFITTPCVNGSGLKRGCKMNIVSQVSL
jgi:hypothetical protein